MTQMNLLPDVKLEYLRTTRNKRLVMGISFIVIAVSVGVMLLMASIVYGFQKKSLADLNDDIKLYNQQLKDTKDLDKVLTIQNQLASMTKLHEDKPVVARVFNYLTQVTPTTAGITQFDLDTVETTMLITGEASTLDAVNTYVDTLKFTKFAIQAQDGSSQSDSQAAFSEVVLTQFGRSATGATFTISLKYDSNIFNVANDIKLDVPNIKSTRSYTEQPTDLFKESTTQKETQ